MLTLRVAGMVVAVLTVTAAAPLLAQSSSGSPEGPFGLASGMSAEAIEAASGTKLQPVPQQPGVFMASTVPRPHSKFERYILLLTPKTGLCKVVAYSADISSSSHGVELQREFQEMVDIVASIYGKSTVIDRLRAGSIWSKPEDWMMGVLRKERLLLAVWSDKSGATLKNDLASVGLSVGARSSVAGYLELGYEFGNFDACKAAMQDAQKSGL